MLVKQRGGMTEFIPTPSEKRDGVIRNHVLELLANLDERLKQIETARGLPSELAEEFRQAMLRIRSEEAQVRQINDGLLAAGIASEDILG